LEAALEWCKGGAMKSNRIAESAIRRALAAEALLRRLSDAYRDYYGDFGVSKDAESIVTEARKLLEGR
jgi:hypothetical protein